MNCNLTKEKKVIKDSNGKERNIYNYFLVLPNGQRIAIVAKYFPTENIKDKETLEQVEKFNVSNATLLSAFADLIKKDEK